jgi:hypothetical protein
LLIARLYFSFFSIVIENYGKKKWKSNYSSPLHFFRRPRIFRLFSPSEEFVIQLSFFTHDHNSSQFRAGPTMHLQF